MSQPVSRVLATADRALREAESASAYAERARRLLTALIHDLDAAVADHERRISAMEELLAG